MIIFSDFDDTLYPHGDETAFATNLQAVQSFRRAGHPAAIAAVSPDHIVKNVAELIDLVLA